VSRSEDFHERVPDTVSYGKYLIRDTGFFGASAHTYNPDKWNGVGKRIGSLSWYPGEVHKKEDGSYDDASGVNGGVIHGVHVSKQFRRKGIASAMLDFARERSPEKNIRHSNALSENGANWAQANP
jgi:ribosomal protein S18 acetylase RimI-like enzyme